MFLLPCSLVAMLLSTTSVSTVPVPADTGTNVAVKIGVKIDTASAPILTVDQLTRFKTFWQLLMHEPPAISDSGVHQYRQKLNMSDYTIAPGGIKFDVDDEQSLDLVKLARHYPIVSTDLKKAGLTLPAWEQIRLIVVKALILKTMGLEDRVTPQWGANVQLLGEHAQDFNVDISGLWMTWHVSASTADSL